MALGKHGARRIELELAVWTSRAPVARLNRFLLRAVALETPSRRRLKNYVRRDPYSTWRGLWPYSTCTKAAGSGEVDAYHVREDRRESEVASEASTQSQERERALCIMKIEIDYLS
jgi:hypothetical protein